MTKLVTGIGGLFFRAKDSKALALWYEKHFGIGTVEQGGWQQQAGPTVFAPFKEDTTYFGNPSQQFMLNLRVSDLDKLLEELKAAGVRIDPKSDDESYGKFAWVYDPEGNKIELWEPSEKGFN
jgi:catechol 2,3-dioxygenase-like lactoylglutathione lyase family enzyme